MAKRPLFWVRWNICVLLVGLLVFSWGYFIYSYSSEYRSIEEQASRNAASQALGFEVHTRQTIRLFEVLLHEVARDFPLYSESEFRGKYTDWFQHAPELAGLAVVDNQSEETLFALNQIKLPEFFSGTRFAHQESDYKVRIADRLFSGSDGRNLLALIHPFELKNRNLTAVALLYADHLLDFHQEANLGPNGSLAIFHHKGLLLARDPFGEKLVGKSFAQRKLFTELLLKSPVGLSHTPETTDGVRRVVAHRKLADMPLVVTVGASLDWIYADLQKRLWRFVVIQFAVTLMIAISLLLLFRSLGRVEIIEADLEEREEHFRAVANSSVDAVISVSADERIRFWSAGAEQTFGCPSSESLNMPISCFLQFADEAKPLTLKQLSIMNSPWSQQKTMEVQGQRKNAELFPTELSISRATVAGKALYTLIVRDVTERRQMEDRIRRLASHDNLTGLPNRALLMDRLQVAMAQIRRQAGQFALLFVDLDHFKPVNDSYGHEMGDLVLQGVAQRMQEAVRASDTVARVGGDEFAVLLSNVDDRDSVCRACDHLLDSLREKFILSGTEVQISCSIGVILYDGQEVSASELVSLADQAMYAAKHAGKNQFCFSSMRG